MYDLKLPSKKYPDLHYIGEDDPLYEFPLHPEDKDFFLVHLFEDVAKNEEATQLTGKLLDCLDDIDKRARKTIEEAILDENHPVHETVKDFLDLHLQADCSKDELKELFQTQEDPHALSPVELMRLLGLKKMFTYFAQEETETGSTQLKQFFSIDYMFNEEMTDEILTLVLDEHFEIISIDAES